MSKMRLVVIGAAIITAIAGASAVVVLQSSSDNTPQIFTDPILSAGQQAAEDCRVCHALYPWDQYRVGPTLWEIVGADKARMEGYAYSRALATAEGVWSESELDAFLEDPHGFLPGTRMIFDGITNDDHRKSLVAFLVTLQD